MLVLYERWKKHNEQLTKNKKDSNIRKMTNHPPSPGSIIQYGYRNLGTHARVFPKHLRVGTARTK